MKILSKHHTAIIIFTGLMISLAVFFLIKNWEESSRLNEFGYKSADHAAAIQTEFEHIAKIIANTRALIDHDINAEHNHPHQPESFMPLAASMLLDDPALLTVAWAAYDHTATSGPHLKVIYIRHGTHPDANADDLELGTYYDEHADIADLLQKQRPVHAIIHQDSSTSHALSDHEMNFIAPVFRHTSPTTGMQQVGALIVEFSVDALIERAIAKLPVAAQDIRLYIVDNQGQQHLVHTHISRSRSAAEMDIRTGLGDSVPFDFSGLHWQLRFDAAPHFFRKHPIVLAWQSLLICLLLTGFLAWYVRSTSRQTIIIEDQVEKRTAELAKLATVIEQAAEIVLITDKNGLIEYVNPAFTRISGFSAEEAIGRTPAIIKSGQHSNDFYQAMWTTLHHGKVWRYDFTNRNKHGEQYTVKQTITPIMDEQGNITAFASVQRDITRELQIEQQLQHTDRVESLGVLAGGIAHDFNNLLAAILGNAALAQKKLNPTSPAVRHLDAIESASNSAADLCRQMLAYSGKGQFVIKAINLSTLVEEMGKLIDVSLAKNVVLKYELSPQLPAIHADVAQMQQVVLNLITNASEAIDGNSGVICIATGVMHADADYLQSCVSGEQIEPGRYVYLEISDTGCGMDSATQQKIFDPFFTTKFTGRGLGMSAMLGIVKSHQGAMRIYSEPGQGTTIKVAFPLSPQAIITDSSPAAPSVRFSGTALVIDDEETVREVACAILEDIGFDTITANNGLEGVEVFRHHQEHIALVILDMTMPKMNGGDCFRELKRMNPHVKVILSSGYNEQDATSRFVGKGLAGFIQKPYAPDALAEKINQILNIRGNSPQP